MELASNEPHRYAGLGLMLSQPQCELRFVAHSFSSAHADEVSADGRKSTALSPSPVGQLSAHSEIASKVEQVIQLRYGLDRSTPPFAACGYRIELTHELPLHTGLGAGTQLAAAVATGLEILTRLPINSFRTPSPCEEFFTAEETSAWQPISQLEPAISASWLARNSGRGLRSAVGIIGFLKGGLILDEGYLHPDSATGHDRPLAAQTNQLASQWQIVVITPPQHQPVCGEQEAHAMAQLGSTANPRRSEMLALASQAITLSNSTENFEPFVECLDRYMYLAAQLFSPYQAGLYNGRAVTQAVELARDVGLRAVGQSSWGPTVFGFSPNANQAQLCANQLRSQQPDWSIRVCTPDTQGAQYRISDAEH